MRQIVRNIFLLAINGFNEVFRHKFFYGMAAITLLIIGIGIILGSLSMSEEKRIAVDFGLFAVQIILIVASVFFGSLSITKDIERKILMTLITRPLTRSQYILGKFFSIALVILTALIILGVLLAGLFYFFSAPINFIFIKSLWGIYLESLVLLAVSIFFGTFSSPFLIICYSFSYFIVGHWIDTVREIVQESDKLFPRILTDYIFSMFPNLEKFNWRSHVVYQDALSHIEVCFYSFYALFWIILALTASIYIFNRRDFV